MFTGNEGRMDKRSAVVSDQVLFVGNTGARTFSCNEMTGMIALPSSPSTFFSSSTSSSTSSSSFPSSSPSSSSPSTPTASLIRNDNHHIKKPTEIKTNKERGRKNERGNNSEETSLLTTDKRNYGGAGERRGRRGESKECVNNSKKGVIGNDNFVERKGRIKERRKQDEIIEEDEVNAEDKSEGDDKDKGRDVRENNGEGEEEEEGEGEREEGEESTTADALRLMTPWSYQVGRSASRPTKKSSSSLFSVPCFPFSHFFSTPHLASLFHFFLLSSHLSSPLLHHNYNQHHHHHLHHLTPPLRDSPAVGGLIRVRDREECQVGVQEVQRRAEGQTEGGEEQGEVVSE
jgi:hypothetical protein